MANIKVSEMPALSALTGEEWLPAYDPSKALSQQNQRLQIQQILPPGGSVGQILAKASGSNYATEWIEAPSGAGALSVVYRDYADTALAGNVAGNLFSTTIPGNTIGANGELHIATVVRLDNPAGGANMGQLTLTFGAATITLNSGTGSMPGFGAEGYLRLDIFINNRGVTNSQIVTGYLSVSVYEASGPGSFDTTPIGSSGGFTIESAIDTTASAALALVKDTNGDAALTYTHKSTVVTVTA